MFFLSGIFLQLLGQEQTVTMHTVFPRTVINTQCDHVLLRVFFVPFFSWLWGLIIVWKVENNLAASLRGGFSCTGECQLRRFKVQIQFERRQKYKTGKRKFNHAFKPMCVLPCLSPLIHHFKCVCQITQPSRFVFTKYDPADSYLDILSGWLEPTPWFITFATKYKRKLPAVEV